MRVLARAGCRKSLRREQARGPQHHVKPAASSDLQPESRAGHVAVKAMSVALLSGDVRAAGLGGVGGAARVHGLRRNTRGPSAPPGSGQRGSYKPMAKASRAQRESEGVVVPRIVVTNNATGGKGLCFGRARNEGKCQGMADRIGPNHPDEILLVDNARRPLPELWTSAKRFDGRWQRADHSLRLDIRRAACLLGGRLVHASPGRPSVSRVPEIGTHGLKGGPALSPMTHLTV